MSTPRTCGATLPTIPRHARGLLAVFGLLVVIVLTVGGDLAAVTGLLGAIGGLAQAYLAWQQANIRTATVTS